jgi:lysophospholipase L1-like esterase
MKIIIFLITLLLFPFSIMAQSTTPYSKHYYQRVNEFSEEPIVTHKNMIILGNSLTEKGGNWNIRLHKKNILNRGIIGDGASGVYDRLYQILPGQPKKIFLMIGINDISNDLSTDSIKILITKIIDKIQNESPHTKLYLQSLLPINESFGRYKKMINKTDTIPELNSKLQQLATAKRICFINLFPFFVTPGTSILRKELSTDGLHLTEAGYALWITNLKRYL